ncbi:uncharacterized protein BKA55DRAFT_697743 [Fusarium redolens]|uniref:Uncharacterized protein n=1 Tax=Fusarium redolens TaxID=48865 RepID=A0A9P9JQI8_FUSRE|nr:uncharacterized protein BKA55DRAFT_697743 [Fusarium redolens]KAH7213236.1 hypothetical protein BKA55DRAFT_697743 [Fusarium redolens]
MSCGEEAILVILVGLRKKVRSRDWALASVYKSTIHNWWIRECLRWTRLVVRWSLAQSPEMEITEGNQEDRAHTGTTLGDIDVKVTGIRADFVACGHTGYGGIKMFDEEEAERERISFLLCRIFHGLQPNFGIVEREGYKVLDWHLDEPLGEFG